MVYIREGIPSRKLTFQNTPIDIQIIPFELNLNKQKWVFFAIYRPPKQHLNYFLEHLSAMLDFYYEKYDRLLLIGDFNIETENIIFSDFIDSYDMASLINDKTCYKSTDGTCIDLLLTNCKKSVINCLTIETGISDHHLMIYGMLKATYSRLPPKEFIYRSYKNFDLNVFLDDLSNKLAENVTSKQNYKCFQQTYEKVLEIHAPCKKKVIRGNSKPHVTKTLRKEIMRRSQLKNVANKTKLKKDIDAYKKQRNLVVNLNKTQKHFFFSNIDTNDPKKSLWEVCKPYFSNKGTNEEKIILLEDDTVTTDDETLANKFNEYFCNITKGLQSLT